MHCLYFSNNMQPIQFLKKISVTSSFIFLVFLSFNSYVNAAIETTSGNAGGGSVTGITYDCGLDSSGNPIMGKKPGDCNFYDFIAAIKKIINVGTILALAFSVVIIAWAGFIYLKSGGSASERAKANKMFVSVGLGIAFLLGAWLIVNLVVSVLVDPALRNSASFPI